MSVQNATHSHLTWCFSHIFFLMDFPISKDFKLSQQLSVTVNPPTVLWHCKDEGCNPMFSNANGSNLMNKFSAALNRIHHLYMHINKNHRHELPLLRMFAAGPCYIYTARSFPYHSNLWQYHVPLGNGCWVNLDVLLL